MRALSICLIAAIVIGVASCSDDDSTPNTPTDSQVVMPLAVGNYWVFDYERYEDGQLTSTKVDTIRIESTVTDNESNTWYLAWDSRANSYTHYRNSNLGLEIRVEGMGSIRLQYPAETNATETFTFADEPFVVTVLNNDTTVTTPLGSFQCLKYGLGDGESHFRYHYWSPGVGAVGYSDVGSGSVKTEARLRNYHVQ